MFNESLTDKMRECLKEKDKKEMLVFRIRIAVDDVQKLIDPPICSHS